MVYDAKKGYGLQLLGFDMQYEDCIIYRNTKEEIMNLADKLMRGVGHCDKGLMDELNEMQSVVSYRDPNSVLPQSDCFSNKYTIPTYFINLILEKNNMRVLGW